MTQKGLIRCKTKQPTDQPTNQLLGIWLTFHQVRMWHKGILWWELKPMRGQTKNAWSRRHSQISHGLTSVKKVLPGVKEPWNQANATKRLIPPTRGTLARIAYGVCLKPEVSNAKARSLMTNQTKPSLMVRFQWCWSFGESGVLLHCHCSQVHSGPEW